MYFATLTINGETIETQAKTEVQAVRNLLPALRKRLWPYCYKLGRWLVANQGELFKIIVVNRMGTIVGYYGRFPHSVHVGYATDDAGLWLCEWSSPEVA